MCIRDSNNLGLWFDKSCLQFFNSTVAPSIMRFYPEVGVKRDVNSKPDADNYALRGLLSVRYTLVAKEMCIRDSGQPVGLGVAAPRGGGYAGAAGVGQTLSLIHI